MRASERGMTLIELMVSLAIASVLVTTATALITTLSQVKRDSEHVLEVRGNAATALNLIQFDGLNAGYRFASAPFAVRVLPSVSGSEAELAPITDTANCGTDATWGLAVGSDVVEFSMGLDGAEPSDIISGACSSGSCTGVQTTVLRGAPIDPSTDEVVLLSDGVSGCLGRVLGSSVPPSYDLQLIRQDYVDANAGTYNGCLGTLSVNNRWKFMKLGARQRYYVCTPPAAQPNAKPQLFKMVSNSKGVWDITKQTLVQDGIEDLQISWQVADPLGELTGGSCNGLAAARVCECNGFGGACLNFVPAPTITGTLDAQTSPLAPWSNRAAYSIRGIGIGITSINTRSRVVRGSGQFEMFTRPVLFDHLCDATCLATKSGDLRSTQVVSIVLQNVVMVKP